MPTLSVYDPTSGGFVNIDGGAKSQSVLLYLILVELRTMNEQLSNGTSVDVANIRADQSVADPLFANVR